MTAEASVLDQRPQPWQRRTTPVLSAHTTAESWCRIVLYSPHVLHVDGKYRMWYVGTSTASRSDDMALGYAESEDGIQWEEHAQNPVLTGDDLPWAKAVQTPYVLFDREERVYKMWFTGLVRIDRDERGGATDIDQRVGYATSGDGRRWEVLPRPICDSGRSPCVVQEGPEQYRMWVGCEPTPDSPYNSIYANICELTSPDGIEWTRVGPPAIRPSGLISTCVYPFVLKTDSQYLMWYGGHRDGGLFEVFCASSSDGSHWTPRHDVPAFPATHQADDFDGRYTSTPCVIEEDDRYLLYYSARDWENEYTDSEGQKRRDGAGVYAHIGLAVCPKNPPK